MRIAAVILAGGKGERLGGVNKALLDIGGRSLLERALTAVAPSVPIVLATGRLDFAAPGTLSVPDLDTPVGGPLAGLAAAVARLRDAPPDWLLSLAVDTPFFPADFTARALATAPAAPALVAAYGGQLYPTNTLWRFDAVADLPERLRAGAAPPSLMRFGTALGWVPLDYAATTPDNPFLNANTPEELALLRRRAASSA
jgi:molybdopterin-guanine dinucleotide biosynthesis protein A